MMDQATINRYQPTNPDTGYAGDIYSALQAQYGSPGANVIAQAALTGDESQINAAIVSVKYGSPLPTSTTSILAGQLESNPLGAPLDALNNQLVATIGAFFKNPAVVFCVALALFLWLGGADYLKGILAKKK